MKKLFRSLGIGLIVFLVFNMYFYLYETKKELQSQINNNQEIANIRLNYLDKQTKEIIEIEEINRDIDIVRTSVSNFFIRSILTINAELNKAKTELNVIKDTITEINPEYLLRGSVIVSGIFGSGSGTVIGKTDNAMYVLSCYHVVSEIIEMNKKGIILGATVGYTKVDEFGEVRGIIMYGADIIKSDEAHDLVLLKIYTSDSELNVIKLAQELPQKGDVVYSVGNPLGTIRTLSKGILSNIIEGFYISDNTTTYGNSGGSLYNERGELIGVPARVMGYPAGINKNGEEDFVPESGLGESISLEVIKEFLKDSEIKV